MHFIHKNLTDFSYLSVFIVSKNVSDELDLRQVFLICEKIILVLKHQTPTFPFNIGDDK